MSLSLHLVLLLEKGLRDGILLCSAITGHHPQEDINCIYLPSVLNISDIVEELEREVLTTQVLFSVKDHSLALK